MILIDESSQLVAHIVGRNDELLETHRQIRLFDKLEDTRYIIDNRLASKTISRVMSLDVHLSRPAVASRFKRPT